MITTLSNNQIVMSNMKNSQVTKKMIQIGTGQSKMKYRPNEKIVDKKIITYF